jgi:hypothetical protein
VAFPRPTADPHRAPPEFDDLVDWFEQISTNLVLLEDYPRDDLRTAIDRFEAGVRAHLRSYDLRLNLPRTPPKELSDVRALLRSDHAWFQISLEQLEWFYRIVEGEDHGGHRQALGQYGRVFAEALRRHRLDERNYLSAVEGPVGSPPP